MFLRKNFLSLPALATLAVISNSVPAIAQTSQPDNTVNHQVQEFSQFTTTEIEDATIVPIPGTVATSSSVLTSANTNNFPSVSTQTVPQNQVAQGNIDLGRPTRGGSSYVGLAGNIGLSGGESALGDGNFAIISKIGFTRSLSTRPSVILGDDVTFLIPITYDFNFQPIGDPFSEPLPISPYIGAGAAIKTGDDSETAFMLTGGVDVPLNSRFTATAVVNAGFFNQTDVGLMIGVGYNFSGF